MGTHYFKVLANSKNLVTVQNKPFANFEEEVIHVFKVVKDLDDVSVEGSKKHFFVLVSEVTNPITKVTVAVCNIIKAVEVRKRSF